VKVNDLPHQVDEWGRVIFPGSAAVELLLRGYTVEDLLITPDAAIADYNQHCRDHNKADCCITAIAEPSETPLVEQDRRITTWFVPPPYCELDVRQELLARCQRPDEVGRVNMEMDLYEQRGWQPLLRLLFYLVDDFRRRGILWGVGRGSSVASYCLFLIGVHRIDSILYDLPIKEFLK
jgi:DNA polymerase III alpha subunit